MTNVLDETLSPEDFAALYRERWRIEEAFKAHQGAPAGRELQRRAASPVEQDFCDAGTQQLRRRAGTGPLAPRKPALGAAVNAAAGA